MTDRKLDHFFVRLQQTVTNDLYILNENTGEPVNTGSSVRPSDASEPEITIKDNGKAGAELQLSPALPLLYARPKGMW
jgi:hypothetical protein